MDLHILPLFGHEVVLGMDWLESLGRATHNYADKSMEIVHEDKLIVLRGLPRLPKQIAVYSLATLMSYATVFELLELELEEPDVSALTTDRAVVFPVNL